MAEKLGLDSEKHELKLGSSFGSTSHSQTSFHSLRYDFKPASVDTSKMGAVGIGEKNSVSVTLPHVEGSGISHTVYKGNKQPCKKECILIIDHKTGEITLEKLANNIQLKKTRCTRLGSEHGLCDVTHKTDSPFVTPAPPSKIIINKTTTKDSQGITSGRERKEAKSSFTPERIEKASDCLNDRLKLYVSKSEISSRHHGHKSKTKTPKVNKAARSPDMTRINSCVLTPAESSRYKQSIDGKLSEKLSEQFEKCSTSEEQYCNLIIFAQSIQNDIQEFLEKHTLRSSRQPYVSSAFSLQRLEQNHPDIYRKVLKRMDLSDKTLDDLNSHLCHTFPSYLGVRAGGVYGCIQRLEDLVDFILERYSV